jgi:transcriptional regulator with GAF, ATPase, and Fis domain
MAIEQFKIPDRPLRQEEPNRDEWTPEFKAAIERMVEIERRLGALDYEAELHWLQLVAIRQRHNEPHERQAYIRQRRSPETENLIDAVREIEREMIRAALKEHGKNKAQAAQALGITRRMLGYRMKNLGID